jgi:signal transduction histidine kinase
MAAQSKPSYIRLFYSLRFRLLVTLLLAMLLTLAISALFATRSVTSAFQDFLLTGTRAQVVIMSLSSGDESISVVTDDEYQEFVQAVNKALALAIIIAGSIAIALILILLHPTLRLIEALTNAAKRMMDGDLSQRVRVRSRDEIGQLGNSFNEMADSLERVERLRRNMVSDVAHELRTPLSSIRGYMEGLRDDVITPTTQLFEALHEETELLTRLVNDLQDLALAEAGQLKLNCAPTAIRDVMSRAVSAMRPSANEKAITLVADVIGNPPPVYVDADRADQMIRNLLKNAIAYTPEGGAVTLTIHTDGDVVAVRVTDTGPGIELQHLPFVFERFYRSDFSRSRATGGAGLGLAIVKQLAEAHGGAVGVDSTVGLGSTFTFTLPIWNGNVHALERR